MGGEIRIGMGSNGSPSILVRSVIDTKFAHSRPKGKASSLAPSKKLEIELTVEDEKQKSCVLLSCSFGHTSMLVRFNCS